MRRKKVCKVRLFVPVLLALLAVFSIASGSKEDVVTKGCVYYVDLYLKQFPNLTLEEVTATVEQESNFNPKLKCIEKKVRDVSHGPMQVRGKTLRKTLYYAGPLDAVCSWELGLYYGMQYLSYCKSVAAKLSSDSETIRRHMWARYNGGTYYYTQNNNGDWIYINENYIRACEKNFKEFSSYLPAH